jgi:myb proto-oncogene protein
LKNAVRTHGGKNWVAIAELVPGRTRIQCHRRWQSSLDPSIDQANKNVQWEEDEDTKLKNAVRTHGGRNWVAITAQIPGRTRSQCHSRWYNCLDPSIDRANARTGKWTSDEDTKLKDAVRSHGGKNWVLIAAIVPGRTKNQCCGRWKNALAPNRRTIREEERDALNEGPAL